MNQTQRDQLLPGLILIALGVLLLFRDRFLLTGEVVLITIGAILIVAYLRSRTYGLLIPGCILTGLGVGQWFGSSALGLGLGFIAIFAVDTLVRGRTSHWWPLIPGVIITGDAALKTNREVFDPVWRVVGDWWPLLLVLLGVLILFRGVTSPRT